MSSDTLMLACPHCSKKMKVPATASGKTIACPSCKGRLKAPTSQTPPTQQTAPSPSPNVASSPAPVSAQPQGLPPVISTGATPPANPVVNAPASSLPPVVSAPSPVQSNSAANAADSSSSPLGINVGSSSSTGRGGASSTGRGKSDFKNKSWNRKRWSKQNLMIRLVIGGGLLCVFGVVALAAIVSNLSSKGSGGRYAKENASTSFVQGTWELDLDDYALMERIRIPDLPRGMKVGEALRQQGFYERLTFYKNKTVTVVGSDGEDTVTTKGRWKMNRAGDQFFTIHVVWNGDTGYEELDVTKESPSRIRITAKTMTTRTRKVYDRK